MRRRSATLPGWVQVIVRLSLPSRSVDAALGDLAEEYRVARRKRSRLGSAVWLLAETASLTWGYWRTRFRASAGVGEPREEISPMAEPPPQVGRLPGVEQIGVDVRLALRRLCSAPGFTAVVITTLALGIGLNTAIFNVVNAVLIDPFPYPGAERMVFIRRYAPEPGTWYAAYPATLEKWRRGLASLSRLEAYRLESFTWLDPDEPHSLDGAYVSPGLFTQLEVSPLLGRAFSDEEGQPGADAVVMLSEGLWRRGFGEQQEVFGSQIDLDGRRFTIVGVMPAWFALPTADLWIPRSFDSGEEGGSIRVVGWLRPGIELPAAQAEAELLLSRGQRMPQATHPRLFSPAEYAGRGSRSPLYFLLAAVTFVLLIACANVANLMLARGTRRRREIAIRSALGAGRSRIVRELLIESSMLALVAGGLGVGLAHMGVGPLVSLMEATAQVPEPDLLHLDGTVLAWAFAVSVATALLSGTWPASQVARTSPSAALQDGGPQAGSDRRQRLVRRGLVGLQVALCLTLLVGAGLLINSLGRLHSVEPGFDSDRVLSVSISLPEERYPATEQRRGFFDTLMERVRELRGVESVSLAGIAPPFPSMSGIGEVELDQGSALEVDVAGLQAFVAPGFFRTLGIPLVRGRGFTETDPPGMRGGIIINQSFADRLFPDQDPIGKGFETRASGAHRILGVVADVNQLALDFSIAGAQMYHRLTDAPRSSALLVRVTRPSAEMVQSIKSEVWAVDPTLPLEGAGTLAERLAANRYLERPRAGARLLSLFSGLALALASVGILGVVSYTVSERTREIGIRMALGADGGDVQRMITRQAMGPVLLGMLPGIAGGLGIGRLLRGVLFEVSASDPTTILLAISLLGAMALLASWIPARRATSIPPLSTLRTE